MTKVAKSLSLLSVLVFNLTTGLGDAKAKSVGPIIDDFNHVELNSLGITRQFVDDKVAGAKLIQKEPLAAARCKLKVKLFRHEVNPVGPALYCYWTRLEKPRISVNTKGLDCCLKSSKAIYRYRPTV